MSQQEKLMKNVNNDNVVKKMKDLDSAGKFIGKIKEMVGKEKERIVGGKIDELGEEGYVIEEINAGVKDLLNSKLKEA